MSSESFSSLNLAQGGDVQSCNTSEAKRVDGASTSTLQVSDAQLQQLEPGT